MDLFLAGSVGVTAMNSPHAFYGMTLTFQEDTDDAKLQMVMVSLTARFRV